MIELILGPIAPYIMGFLGLVAAWFFGKSKLAGKKVESLKKDVLVEQENNNKLKQEIELNKKREEMKDDMQKVGEAVVKSGVRTNRERLSEHFTRNSDN